MPIFMQGQDATIIVQGDYHDSGNQFNTQVAHPGNYSLFIAGISDLIYYCIVNSGYLADRIRLCTSPPH